MAEQSEVSFELLDYMERRSQYLKGVESFEKEVKKELNKMETLWGEKIFYNSVISAAKSVLLELHAKARVKEVTHVDYRGPYLPSVKLDNSDWRFTMDRTLRRRRDEWLSCIVFLYPEQKKLLVNYTLPGKQHKKRSTKVALTFSGAETPPVIRLGATEQKRKNVYYVVEFEGLKLLKADFKSRKQRVLTLGFSTQEDLDAFLTDCQVFIQEPRKRPKDLEDLSLEQFDKIRKSIDLAALFEVVKGKHDPAADLEALVTKEVRAYFEEQIRNELN